MLSFVTLPVRCEDRPEVAGHGGAGVKVKHNAPVSYVDFPHPYTWICKEEVILSAPPS